MPSSLTDQIRDAVTRDTRTRIDLAKAADLHHINLYQFLGGKRSLPLPALERLAAALGGTIKFHPPRSRRR